MSAPTLGLPDLAKPFTLCDRKGQRWLWECCPRLWGHGTDPGLISNQLGNVATGRLGCLRAVDAVALLIWEATKLTLGQDLFVEVPHEVNTLLRGDPHKWLSTFRITQYQGLICENLHLLLSLVRP